MRDAVVCYLLTYLDCDPARLESKHLQRQQGSMFSFLGTGHTTHFSFGSSVPWNEPLTIAINTRHSASRGKDTLHNLHV